MLSRLLERLKERRSRPSHHTALNNLTAEAERERLDGKAVPTVDKPAGNGRRFFKQGD